MKEESEKIGLKLNIQKTKIMASGPITSWQINGATVETVSDFIFEGSKITVDGDCSHIGAVLMTMPQSRVGGGRTGFTGIRQPGRSQSLILHFFMLP